MKPFPVSKFLRLMRTFEQGIHEGLTEGEVDTPVANDETERKRFSEQITQVADECEECFLPSSADQFRRLGEGVKNGILGKDFLKLLPDTLNRIEDECKRHVVMAIEPEYLEYFRNAQFFDPKDVTSSKVSVAFPSANEDIAEAGKCLASGRSTACVMHLGRVLEVGLKTLAAAVSVKPQNDWGKYLEGIERELNSRVKTAGARSVNEQFYAEAHLTFDNVRRAWRNPTMHIEKTYTSERAEEILIAVRSFMRHLATHIHE